MFTDIVEICLFFKADWHFSLKRRFKIKFVCKHLLNKHYTFENTVKKILTLKEYSFSFIFCADIIYKNKKLWNCKICYNFWESGLFFVSFYSTIKFNNLSKNTYPVVRCRTLHVVLQVERVNIESINNIRRVLQPLTKLHSLCNK